MDNRVFLSSPYCTLLRAIYTYTLTLRDNTSQWFPNKNIDWQDISNWLLGLLTMPNW